MSGIRQRIRQYLRRHPALYRWRFAWITEVGEPDGFREAGAETRSHHAPRAYREVVDRLKLRRDTSFTTARRIAFDLSCGHRRGRGFSCDSVSALQGIYAGRGGTCSDYSQVYLGLCAAAGIRAREWGLCDDFRSPTIGHSFNEVYCSELQRWVFVDPMDSVYAVSRRGGLPLSVIEMVDLTTAQRADEVEFAPIDGGWEGRGGRPTRDVYLNPGHLFFLVVNNQVFAQDAALRWAGICPLPLLHGTLLVLGRYQRYRLYLNGQNREAALRKLGALRARRSGTPPNVGREVGP